MRPPDDTRHAIVSGSISLFAHGAALAAILVSAWLAPEVANEIIEVRILKDLPGSNEEPAPAAPRVLAPRRAIANAARAAAVAPRPAAVARPSAQAVSAQALQVANIDATTAPTEIARRQVTSQRIVAQNVLATAQASSVDLARIPATDVAPVDLTAPRVESTGPRQIAPGQQIAVTAPQAFTGYNEVAEVDYTAQAAASAASSNAPIADTGFAIDAEAATARIGTGGGSGGAGAAVGVARCLESRFVQEYYDLIGARTTALWRDEIPPDTPADARVVLAFRLDEAGSPSGVRIRKAPTPELGEGCRRALLDAAPFPAMDANVRCLAGRPLTATFNPFR